MSIADDFDILRSPDTPIALHMWPGHSMGLIPIRSLGERHRDQITAHLLALDEHDRYLRFGFVASDEHVMRYTRGLDFGQDELLGITNRKLTLVAMAHLAYDRSLALDASAEFGVSVAKDARGRGFGMRLFERAAMHARNKGVALLFIHALSENAAMLEIARKGGASIERYGSESEAYLRLPPPSLHSRMTEIVDDHYGQVDYRLKAHSRMLHDAVAAIKTLNCGWQAGGRSNTG